MIQTSDGGLTWQSRLVRNSDNARFTATSFVDDRLGWAVGTNGRVLSTIDGGRSWFAQRSNIDLDLFDVKFVDGVNGWVVGNEGTVLHTTNGGAHWALERTATNHALDRLFFVDPNHGWAVGFGGIILSYGSSVPPQLR